MQKSILVLPDGTELFSGKGTANALMNVELKEVVNSDTELTPGSVCCACIEATLIAPGGDLSIAAGTEVTAFTEYDDGSREQTGVFNLEKPTRSSANTYKLIAYDHVAKLDVDLTAWFTEQAESFPMNLQDLVELVCDKCGVTLKNNFIPHGDFSIPYFSVGEVTGRKLLQWAAQIGARYVHATEDGQIEFAWYTKKSDVSIATSQSEVDGVISVPYFEGSLTYEDYEVAPVQKVQIRYSDEDVGVVWPSDVEEGNTYVVSTNYMLTGMTASDLQYVAQSLYQALMNFAYVPCKVSVPRGSGLKAGDIVTVTDANGITFDTCIMTRTVTAGKEVLECTGSPSRGSSTAVNNRTYEALEGRVLNIKTSVEGLKVENKDLKENYSKLSLDVSKISTEVGDAKENITTLQQIAGQVSVTAKSEQGTLTTTISNDGTWKSEYVDANGKVLSGIYFDFLKQAFVFDGTGKFTGELDVGDGNFIVDINGNVTSRGDTKIYGGKYYAMDDTGAGGYTMMDVDGFSVYSYDAVRRIKVGFPNGHQESPFIVLNGGSLETAAQIIVKQFENGMWLGNDAPMSAYGIFTAQEGYNGIFISLEDSKTYVVSGTNMQNVYTGEAIARFG